MTNESRWYCVSRDDIAMLCVNEADAQEEAAHLDSDWPADAPHRAVQLGDVAAEREQCVLMEKDAARYRWLRDQHWNTGELAVVADPMKAIKLGHDSPSRERLDEAIDAAMAAKVASP